MAILFENATVKCQDFSFSYIQHLVEWSTCTPDFGSTKSAFTWLSQLWKHWALSGNSSSFSPPTLTMCTSAALLNSSSASLLQDSSEGLGRCLRAATWGWRARGSGLWLTRLICIWHRRHLELTTCCCSSSEEWCTSIHSPSSLSSSSLRLALSQPSAHRTSTELLTQIHLHYPDWQ